MSDLRYCRSFFFSSVTLQISAFSEPFSHGQTGVVQSLTLHGDVHPSARNQDCGMNERSRVLSGELQDKLKAEH